MLLVYCLLALLGSIQQSPPGPPGADSPIQCALLASDRKVIPIEWRGERWHTNVCLPVIVLTNVSPHKALLQRLDVIGSCQGNEYVRNSLFEGDLTSMAAEVGPLLNRLMSNPENPWRAYNLKKMFGNVAPREWRLVEANPLQPGESLCFDLGKRIHLQYEGPVQIDEILLRLTVNLNGENVTVDRPLMLTRYECKGDYIFPLRGRITITAMPLNEMQGHRDLPSSEFAFDVIDCRRLENGVFSTSSPPHSVHAADYYAFGREVLAVGDGVVTSVGRGWPDAWMENPLKFTDERIVQLTQKLIDRGVDFQNAYLGNYVIINHRNGEFSAYVHLAENSIPVEVGEMVKQGQVIGKIGNTGNSDEPHLHFQLMDGPDYASANGLPVMFRNVPVSSMPGMDLVEANTLLGSDYFFFTVE